MTVPTTTSARPTHPSERTDRRLTHPGAVVAAVLIALVLAACGSDDSDGNGAASNGNGAPSEGEGDPGEAAGADCTATDERLPDAPDRDLVALVPVPDGLTDDGDTFDPSTGIAASGRTNADVDPEAAAACVDRLVDELGWEVSYQADEGDINTPNGHTVVATHPDLPNLCLNATLFASAQTRVVAGDSGARMEFSLRELPEGMECNL